MDEEKIEIIREILVKLINYGELDWSQREHLKGRLEAIDEDE